MKQYNYNPYFIKIKEVLFWAFSKQKPKIKSNKNKKLDGILLVRHDK